MNGAILLLMIQGFLKRYAWRVFNRVVPSSLRSAISAESERLKKTGKAPTSLKNPFWRYFALQIGALLIVGSIAGVWGILLFGVQAMVAIFQLELINYIEHYGLSRRKLDNGKYEPVHTRHSWNTNERFSSWYLINLQRHSDHHAKPARPYPLLQNYRSDQAPLMPYGYQVMTLIALVPPVWRKVMNPRVRAWRKQHYPDVIDWPKMARP